MIYKNYINREWINSAAKKTFDNINPANFTHTIGQFQDSDMADVRVAVACAKEAFKTWKEVPAPKRADYLFKAAELLIRDKE